MAPPILESGSAPPGRSEQQLSSGPCFYRSLARHTVGNPDAHESIQNAVLDHYLRVWIDPSNGNYAYYRKIEHLQFRNGGLGTLFAALCCPDRALCPCESLSNREAVLLVIANALNIHLLVSSGSLLEPQIEKGRGCGPLCHVRFSSDPGIAGSCRHKVHTMAKDNTGRHLIGFLLEQKRVQRSLDIREMCWFRNKHWFHPSDESWTEKVIHEPHFHCYNEYKPVQLPFLRSNASKDNT